MKIPLSTGETLVMRALGLALGLFAKLPERKASELDDFIGLVIRAQAIVVSRAKRRVKS